MSLHKSTLHKLSLIISFFVLCFSAFPLKLSAQSSLFSYQCEQAGILFFYQGNPSIWTTYEQARQKLELAIQSYQNQPILTLSGVSLWALRSNEFQIHLSDNPDGTKLVLPSGICGTLVNITEQAAPPPLMNNTGYAFVQSTANGEAFAVVDISPTGAVSIYVEVKGTAFAYAFGQSTPVTNSNGQQIHTVQAGENLFRIAIRYGSTVSAIAAANGISDVTRIYVGQQLLIPASV